MPKSPLVVPSASQPVIGQSGEISPAFFQFLSNVAAISPIVGTGSPEGAVYALQYSVYIDETTPTAPITYRKMLTNISGDTKQGWVVV